MHDRQLAGEVAEGRHVVVTAALGVGAPSGAAAPVSAEAGAVAGRLQAVAAERAAPGHDWRDPRQALRQRI